MFLKYSIYIIEEVDLFWESIKRNGWLFIIVFMLSYSLGPISHWTFASQYMKTCFLTKGIVKKACLLLERHQTVIENELEHSNTLNSFFIKHAYIDQEVKNEQAKSNYIQKIFLIIDISFMIVILGSCGFLWYQYNEKVEAGLDTYALVHFVVYLFAPSIDAMISLSLALSVYHLAK